MADEQDPSQASQGGQETTETPAPAAPVQSTLPDDVKATLESAKRLVEETKQERLGYLRTMQALATQSQPAEREPVDDLPEVDEAVAKRIATEVSRANQKLAATFEQAYTKDRQADMAYRANLETERLESRFAIKDPDFKRELTDYVNQLPVDLRARQDVLDESYFAVKGRRAHAAEQEAARRAEASSVASSARTQSGGFTPSFTADDLAVARRISPTMTDRELEMFSNKAVNIDEYRALKASQGGKK